MCIDSTTSLQHQRGNAETNLDCVAYHVPCRLPSPESHALFLTLQPKCSARQLSYSATQFRVSCGCQIQPQSFPSGKLCFSAASALQKLHVLRQRLRQKISRGFGRGVWQQNSFKSVVQTSEQGCRSKHRHFASKCSIGVDEHKPIFWRFWVRVFKGEDVLVESIYNDEANPVGPGTCAVVQRGTS